MWVDPGGHGAGRLRIRILVIDLDDAFESDDVSGQPDNDDHQWIHLGGPGGRSERLAVGPTDPLRLPAGTVAAGSGQPCGRPDGGTLWPNLANYFVDPALKSEQTFLVGVKMGQLNGPTSFDLGTPKVSTHTPTTATVTGCIHDTGTTTAAGNPGPTSLGGGAGSYSGTWTLGLIGGSWKIASYRTATVPKC